jgi:hypothetical protein
MQRMLPSVSLNHAAFSAPSTQTLSTVLKLGRSYSSKTTPFSASAFTTSSIFSTVQLRAVWSAVVGVGRW